MSAVRSTAALVLATCLAPWLGAQDRKAFERLVPENATAFLSVRNISAARKWLEASALGEVWKSREVQDFWTELWAQVEADVKEKEAFREAVKMLEAIQGELAVAVGDLSRIDPADKTAEVPLILLADVSAAAETARETLKRVVQLVRDKANVRITESDFRGAMIQTFAPRDDGEERNRRMYFTETGGLAAFSLSRQLLQDVLANRTESAVKPLAENPEHKGLSERFGKDAAVSFYVNTTGLVQTVPKLLSASGQPEAQQAAMVLPPVFGLLGLANVKSLWLSTTLGKDEIAATYFLSMAGAPRGLLKIFAVKPQALKFPGSVPDDVASAFVVRYNPEALWELIEGAVKLASNFLPMADAGGDGGGPRDPISTLEAQLGVKFKQDMISTLGGQLSYYDRLPDKGGLAGQSKVTLLLDIKDHEKLQSTIDKLLTAAPILEKGEYLGRPIYRVPDGELEDAEAGDEAAGGDVDRGPVAVALAGSSLIFGIPPAQAEEAVRRLGKEVKSVNDAAEFKPLSSLFPPAATSISYQSASSFRVTLEMLQELFSSTLDDAGAPATPDDPADGGAGDGNDADRDTEAKKAQARKLLGKMPKAEVITRPIAGFIGWGFTEERGIGMVSKIVLKGK